MSRRAFHPTATTALCLALIAGVARSALAQVSERSDPIKSSRVVFVANRSDRKLFFDLSSDGKKWWRSHLEGRRSGDFRDAAYIRIRTQIGGSGGLIARTITREYYLLEGARRYSLAWNESQTCWDVFRLRR